MYLFPKVIISFIIVLVTMVGCKSLAQTAYYSYQVGIYTTDTSRHELPARMLISYGDYLFEFKIQINTQTEADLYKAENKFEIKSVLTTYDTTGVYILTNDKRFFEFDTFGINGKLLRQGDLADKGSGYKLGDGKANVRYAPPFVGQPKDTVINNIKCYYADVNSSNREIQDTVRTRFFLYKDKSFASFYKVYGLQWFVDDFCIVGIYMHHYKTMDNYVEAISNLRPLTTAERKICESLIQKAGLPLPR